MLSSLCKSLCKTRRIAPTLKTLQYKVSEKGEGHAQSVVATNKNIISLIYCCPVYDITRIPLDVTKWDLFSRWLLKFTVSFIYWFLNILTPYFSFPMVVWFVSVRRTVQAACFSFRAVQLHYAPQEDKVFSLFPQKCLHSSSSLWVTQISTEWLYTMHGEKRAGFIVSFLCTRKVFQPLISGLTLLISLFLRTRLSCPE